MNILIDSEPKQVKAWLDNNEAILVDIREPQELARSRINGAIHLPLSSFDPMKIPKQPGKRTVFICAHGVRSQKVGEFLLDRGILETAFHVPSGIAGWEQAGLPLDRN